MYLFLNNAAISIVKHKTKEKHLLIRSRNRKSLHNFLNYCSLPTIDKIEIKFTPNFDYPYRLTILSINNINKVMQ